MARTVDRDAKRLVAQRIGEAMRSVKAGVWVWLAMISKAPPITRLLTRLPRVYSRFIIIGAIILPCFLQAIYRARGFINKRKSCLKTFTLRGRLSFTINAER